MCVPVHYTWAEPQSSERFSTSCRHPHLLVQRVTDERVVGVRRVVLPCLPPCLPPSFLLILIHLLLPHLLPPQPCHLLPVVSPKTSRPGIVIVVVVVVVVAAADVVDAQCPIDLGRGSPAQLGLCRLQARAQTRLK